MEDIQDETMTTEVATDAADEAAYDAAFDDEAPDTRTDAEEDDDDQPSEDDDDQGDAYKAAEARGKELLGEDQSEEAPKDESTAEQDEPAKKPKAEPKATSKKPSIAELEAFIDETIPDGTVEIGGVEYNLKDLAGEYQDVAMLAAILANAQAAQLQQQFESRLQAMDEDLRRERFWSAVNREAPGAEQVLLSKEFDGWLEKQPRHLQVLADSGRADDAAALFHAYQEANAKTVAKRVDQQAGARQQSANALLKGTLRGKAAPAKGKNRLNAEEAYDAAWDDDE